jgi:hypothetical protein
MDIINVKICYEGEDRIYRDQITTECTLKQFMDKILVFENREPIYIDYMDEENDWVHVINEEQWSYALKLHFLAKQYHKSPLDIFRIRVRRVARTSNNADQDLPVPTVNKHHQECDKSCVPNPPPPPAPAPPKALLSTCSQKTSPKSVNSTVSPGSEDQTTSAILPNTTKTITLSEAILDAKSTLKQVNGLAKDLNPAAIVQDYFSISGVPRNEFLSELTKKIQQNHSKMISSREELERTKNIKKSLHDELLRKRKRAQATVVSTVQSSPFLADLIKHQRNFRLRQVQKKEELSGFEWIDSRDIDGPLKSPTQVLTQGWLYTLFSKLNF